MAFAALPAAAQTPSSRPSSEATETPVAGERVIVARIFDHEVAANDLVIEGEEEHLRKTLEPDDFERWQRTHRVSSLWSTVVPRALERWADEHGVVVSEEQVERVAQRMLDNWPPKEGQTGNEEVPNEKVKAFTTKFARSMVTERTIARALHEKYGGRVAFGSLGGCVAVEGTEAVLQQLKKDGDLVILDEQLNEQFWQRASEAQGDVVREGARAIEMFDRLDRDLHRE